MENKPACPRHGIRPVKHHRKNGYGVWFKCGRPGCGWQKWVSY